jgi:hypothetical protein
MPPAIPAGVATAAVAASVPNRMALNREVRLCLEGTVVLDVSFDTHTRWKRRTCLCHRGADDQRATLDREALRRSAKADMPLALHYGGCDRSDARGLRPTGPSLGATGLERVLDPGTNEEHIFGVSPQYLCGCELSDALRNRRSACGPVIRLFLRPGARKIKGLILFSLASRARARGAPAKLGRPEQHAAPLAAHRFA